MANVEKDEKPHIRDIIHTQLGLPRDIPLAGWWRAMPGDTVIQVKIIATQQTIQVHLQSETAHYVS